jgi:hypothetical protein
VRHRGRSASQAVPTKPLAVDGIATTLGMENTNEQITRMGFFFETRFLSYVRERIRVWAVLIVHV